MTPSPTAPQPDDPPALRRGHVRLAWALCGLVVGFSAAGLALTFAGPNAPDTTPAFVQTALDSIGPIVFGVVAALIVAHQPRNTIGWLLMALALGVTTLQVVEGYLPLVPDTNVRFRNPLGILPDSVWAIIAVPWTIVLSTTVASCVASVFVRYRRAAGQERAQIKWFLYACAVLLVNFVIASFQEIFATSFRAWLDIAFTVVVVMVPASISIAILRHRLYDIDLIIRRTLVYSALTLTLGLVYISCIVRGSWLTLGFVLAPNFWLNGIL